MNPTQHGLLGSIRETPEDPVPRLVYADWLDENGQTSRAAFLRTQVRGQFMQKDLSAVNRAVKLTDKTLRQEWFPGLKIACDLFFDGGMLTVAEFPEKNPYVALEYLLQAEPLIYMRNHNERYSLPKYVNKIPFDGFPLYGFQVAETFETKDVRNLNSSPWLNDLRVLEMEQTFLDEMFRWLLRTTAARNLEVLCLKDSFFEADELEPLTKTSFFPKLRKLQFVGCRAEPAVAQLLALTEFTEHFHELVFDDEFDSQEQTIGDFGLQCLVGTDWWPQLKTLGLSGQQLTPDGLGILCGRVPPGLQSLDLRANLFGPAELEKLFHTPFAHLRRLLFETTAPSFDPVKLTNVAIHNIFTDAAEIPLESLQLDTLDIDQNGFKPLSDSPAMRKLTSLELTSGKVSAPALASIFSNAEFARRLKHLGLNDIGMTKAGIQRVLADGVGLTSLTISDCRIDDELLEVLTRSKYLQRFRQLTFTDADKGVSARGVEQLLASANLSPECVLTIRSKKVPPALRKRIAKRNPKPEEE